MAQIDQYKQQTHFFPWENPEEKGKEKGWDLLGKLVLGLAFKQEKNARMGTRVKTNGYV